MAIQPGTGIILRTGPSGVGAPLSLEQVDGNFTYLGVEVGKKLNATDYTASDVYSKVLSLNSVDNAGINATTLTGLAPNSNVPSITNKASIVSRDTSGNINGATITASTQFTGNLVGNVTGNVVGNSSTATKLQTPRGINNVLFDGTAAITIYDSTKVLKAGDTMTGFLTLNAAPVNPLHAATKQYVDQYGCPTGAIIMWYGSTLPYGWGLCDGTIQNGIQTPDLRNKFIYGSNTLADSGIFGGSNTVTTSTVAGHSHTGNTGATALSTTDVPLHDHIFYNVYGVADDVANGNYTLTGGVPTYAGMPGAAGSNAKLTDADGNSVNLSFYLNAEYGDDDDQAAYAFKNKTLPNGSPTPTSHTHTIGVDGGHNHTVTGILPPYIKLAYIMKLI